MTKVRASLWLLPAMMLFSGCENIGPLGNPFSGPASLQHPLPIAVSELTQCPRPSGIFQNEDNLNRGGLGLEHFFRVDGPQLRPQRTSGTEIQKRPTISSDTAVHLLGGIDIQGHRYYSPSTGERLTLELRPLTTPARFKVVVRSSLGRTGEGEVSLDLSRSVDNSTGNRCQDGTVRGIYSKTGKVNVAWWVDRDTGDIVGAYQSALERGELSFRYKKIGD